MEKEIRTDAKVQAVKLTPRNCTVWFITGIILAAMAASAGAQGNQQQLAFNTNAAVKSDYSKQDVKYQSQADFGDANLSAQQMIDFFKNEHNKLSKEINDLIAKTAPGKQNSVAVDESDIAQVAILMEKLEYLEVIMKKWITEGDF